MENNIQSNNSQDPSQTPLEPKKSSFYSNRGWLSVLSILVLVLAAFFGFHYLNQKKQESQETKSQTKTPVLATYIDSKFGFQFQYPIAYTPNPSHTVDNSCCYTKEFDNLDNGTDFAVSIMYNTSGKPKTTVDEKMSENNHQESILGK